jgi:hypothetical protein
VTLSTIMDTCEPLIPSSLRTTGFYSLCRYIAAPKLDSSGGPHDRARGQLHTHSISADHFGFPCFCEGIGKAKSNKYLVSGIQSEHRWAGQGTRGYNMMAAGARDAVRSGGNIWWLVREAMGPTAYAKKVGQNHRTEKEKAYHT